MDSAPDLHGLWVPLVTPFTADDRVDEPALRRLCTRVLADGARGIVALGTTGEPDALTAAEREVVLRVCAEVCADEDRPLIAGVGSGGTRPTIEAVAALAGTPALVATLVTVPSYVRPSPAGVLGHLDAVAAASPVPVVAYHVPYRTGCELGAEHLVELAHLPGIVGMKQAVGGVDAATLQLLREAPPGFHLLAGDDAFIVPTTLMGGAGAIAASSHLCTDGFAAMVTAALAGDVVRARTLAHRLLPVVLAGFAEPNPAVWKAALHARGELPTPDLRSPLTSASPAALVRVEQALAEVAKAA